MQEEAYSYQGQGDTRRDSVVSRRTRKQPQASVATPAAENLMVKRERGVPGGAGQDVGRGPGLKPWLHSGPGAPAVGIAAPSAGWQLRSQGAGPCGAGLAPLSHWEHGSVCVVCEDLRVCCAWGGCAVVGEGAVCGWLWCGCGVCVRLFVARPALVCVMLWCV